MFYQGSREFNRFLREEATLYDTGKFTAVTEERRNNEELS